MADMNVTGFLAMLGQLENFADLVEEAAGGALHAEALKVMNTSKKMVPVDTGKLRASAFVTGPMPGVGDEVVVKLGYGTEYAFAVHEAPGVFLGEQVPRSGDAKGFYWDPQGQAQPQFLRKAIDQHSGSFSDDALSRFENFLETGRVDATVGRTEGSQV